MEPIVLVVEDDADNRELVAAVLRDGGYRVWAAEDGCHALDLLEQAGTPPAAMLTDLRMPNMSGFELLDRLRAHPAFSGIPTAIMTAEPSRRPRDPAVPVLQKPFDDVELLRVVDALCQRSGASALPRRPR